MTTLRTWFLATLSFVALLCPFAPTQAVRLGPNCNLQMIGINDSASLIAFDHELKDAVSRSDPAMMALLARFPLRINGSLGTYYLKDAPSLRLRFSEIFVPAVRDAILKQKPENMMCNAHGVMYGPGTVWITHADQRFGIEAINIPSTSDTAKDSHAGVIFVCNAGKHRVIIDATNNGTLRYRDWDTPHSLLDKPDIEIATGEEQLEGTGSCAHRVWIFTNGLAKYSTSELGCYDDPEPPPGTAGELEVSMKDKPDARWWCQ